MPTCREECDEAVVQQLEALGDGAGGDEGEKAIQCLMTFIKNVSIMHGIAKHVMAQCTCNKGCQVQAHHKNEARQDAMGVRQLPTAAALQLKALHPTRTL
jgi:hypothetical protein